MKPPLDEVAHRYRPHLRYAPFAAVVLFLAVLVAVAPSRPEQTVDAALGAPMPGTAGAVTGAGTGTAVTGGTTGPPAAGAAATGGTGEVDGSGAVLGGDQGVTTCAAATGIEGLGQNGLGCGIDPGEAGLWPWTHPWSLSGDRSLCAAGGEVQHAGTHFQGPPCVPRFTGDNGGATAEGVTADEIVVVRYLPRYNDLERTVLESQGLFDSVEDERRAQAAFSAWFERHYDLYGRRIRWVLVQSSCTDPDPGCFRNDARAIVEQHHPFLVQAEAVKIASGPAFFDELSRLGVVTVGGWHISGAFNEERRPYRWDSHLDGERIARFLADYWCQRLNGRNAVLAGDGALRGQQRRLGITVQDTPGSVEKGTELARLISGETCDGPDPVVVTHSADSGQAAQQAAAAVVRFKEAGVTTVVALDSGFTILLTPAMDQQRYYPEHLIAGTNGIDYDVLGRLNSPTQWRNAFGLSERPMEVARADGDDWRVWREIYGDAGEGPCASCPGTIEYEMQVVAQLLWAGPNLTPLTFERGTLESPQLNGYENGAPWPGWSCCDPASVLWRFGPGDRTAHDDLKEVWWDPTGISAIDGQPGTYRCTDGCRRYPLGGFPNGEPVPDKPRP